MLGEGEIASSHGFSFNSFRFFPFTRSGKRLASDAPSNSIAMSMTTAFKLRGRLTEALAREKARDSAKQGKVSARQGVRRANSQPLRVRRCRPCARASVFSCLTAASDAAQIFSRELSSASNRSFRRKYAATQLCP